MTLGDPIVIERRTDGGFEEYFKGHLLQSNKDRSRESYSAGGEHDSETVKFTLRYHPLLAAMEFDKPLFRVLWHGHVFDVREYDDYLYRHREVTIRCVAHE